MSNLSEFQHIGIDLRGRTSGQVKTWCPKCNPEHSNKKGQDLSVNIDEGVYLCHSAKCQWKGTVKKIKLEPVKSYIKPQWKNKTIISDEWVKWFGNRGISQQTLINAKITNTDKCIEFNYFRDDDLINIKSRDINKSFFLTSGAELIFYNFNAFKDAKEIIITEGEIDTLSYKESGLNNVISVPNGANVGKMEYLDSAWELFEGLEKIYIATDNDTPGLSLQKELARRIGIEKCLSVDFKDCKDANDYLVKYGKQALQKTIEDASPFPIEGIVYISTIGDEIVKLYREGLQKGAVLQADEIDNYVSFEPGFMTIITGIPSHGKSEWTDFVATKLNLVHKWKFGIFSPENFPFSFHFSKIAEKLIGKPFYGIDRMTGDELIRAMEYAHENFFFIQPSDDYTIDNILEKARQLVLHYGIKALIIDPYNRLEHQFSNTSETHYISKLLDKIRNFNQRYGVHTFLVAHPTKIKKQYQSTDYEVPTLYDISGSSNFYNKTDIGMTVYRLNNEVQIHVQKVRFKNWGQEGLVNFRWNPKNGRFFQICEDNKSWI